MLEISGDDIARLNDAALRTLVYRLAVAELRKQNCPISSVTAGGSQDAADGGIDVRVDCPAVLASPDFVPRQYTGFQVKRTDMPRSEIMCEMRPDGELRPVIRQLADRSGAYVIVSSQGSVTAKSLDDRCKAIRDALHDLPTAHQLQVDFYDRERLAAWTNEYPGAVAWAREKVGRPIFGWSGISDWNGTKNGLPPFLSNENKCISHEHQSGCQELTIVEGISHMRERLNCAGACVRLIGMSGVGKTRLVQALFQDDIGDSCLDSSLAVYTDYSSEPSPSAREMARMLIANDQRAILIVDNCNPGTHAELAALLSNSTSKLSLLSVEYDVRDDEPENTEVYRLQSASTDIVAHWLKSEFRGVSQTDCRTIAEFSCGNFRIARALAKTVGKGETLGNLKDRSLFERLFVQRNDNDSLLLRAAQDLSLLYSIDGEDVSPEGELARVASIRNVTAESLYEALMELRQRGVVQARGRFRAVLPQAIANRLAIDALERIHPQQMDRFCVSLPARMLKSMSRRLGFLHDSKGAQELVARWLRPDGPLGDLFSHDEGRTIITNIAPVDPATVLRRLEAHLEAPDDDDSFGTDVRSSRKWIWLIRDIGFEPAFFDRAVDLLARLHPGESAALIDFFHIYLSGTGASPAQRRDAIRRMVRSSDAHIRQSAILAMRAMLKTDSFMSSHHCDFGARSRSWGWEPKTDDDRWDWYRDAMKLVVECATDTEARSMIASNIRGLWRFSRSQDVVSVAVRFSKERPWVEGWLGLRAALKYDGKKMGARVEAELVSLIALLKPTDLLNRARAIVIQRSQSGYDFSDGEPALDGDDVLASHRKSEIMAREIGYELATEATIRATFLSELFTTPNAQRAFQCGEGLAQSGVALETLWGEMLALYSNAQKKERNATVLVGFISEAIKVSPSFTSSALDGAVSNGDLAADLPFLQSRAAMDEEGIERLLRAISVTEIPASSFYAIANRVVADSPPELLAKLILKVAELDKGIGVAIEILAMRFHTDGDSTLGSDDHLVVAGRKLVEKLTFLPSDEAWRDYCLGNVIRRCLKGDEGLRVAFKVFPRVRQALESYRFSFINEKCTLDSIFEVQTDFALDTFLLPEVSPGWERNSFHKTPVENLSPEVLVRWANQEPSVRYRLLGKCIRMFTRDSEREHENDGIQPVFLTVLEQATDKSAFLGEMGDRLYLSGGWGSQSDALVRRKRHIERLAQHSDKVVSKWAALALSTLEQWIERERHRERQAEQSFE